MLPAEGSVKDGRTIVYLEIKGPSGGMTDSSQAKGSAGDGSEGAAAETPEAAAAAEKTPRSQPTVKPLLPSSKKAAAKNQADAMIAAAESGAAFCEDCAEAHRLLEEASQA